MDRRNMIGLGLAAAALPKFALADTLMPGDGSVPSDPKEIVTLWPGTPPGGAGVRLPNRIQNRDPGAAPVDRYIDQVGNPSMIVFRADRPDGSAFIVAPGGGYSREMMDFEGTVANCSKDPITHQFRVGVALSEPEADRREKGFLLQLQDRYRPVA